MPGSLSKRTLTSSDASRYSKEMREHEQIENADVTARSVDDSVDPDILEHYTRYPNRWSRIR